MKRRAGLVLLVSAPALAQTPLCEQALVVGVSPLGWSLYEAEGQFRGIVPDLIERLSREAGCPMTLSLRPRARVMLDFQIGELDLVTSAQRTPERDVAGDYVPYAYTGYELVVNPAVESAPRSLAEIESRAQPLVLGFVRGVQLTPAVTQSLERLAAANRVEWAKDFENLSVRMAAGRIHAAVFPTAIHMKLQHDGLLPKHFLVLPMPESPPSPIGLYLSNKRLSGQQRRALAEALRRLVTQGEVRRIYARHLGTEVTERMFSAGRKASGLSL